MVQRFIPAISQGDKRILVIAGEPVPYLPRADPEGRRDARNLARRARGRTTALGERPADRRSAGPSLWAEGCSWSVSTSSAST
jgi:glutathione synthase